MSRILLLAVALISAVSCQSNCIYTDPMGNNYNFNGLRNNSGDYVVNVYPSQYFTLNFCGPVVSNCAGVYGASGCQINAGGLMFIGYASTLNFTSAATGTVMASFSNGTGGRREVITFVCNLYAGVGAPNFTGEFPYRTFNFQWNTSLACPFQTNSSNNTMCNIADDCYDCTGLSGCEWCLETDTCVPWSNGCKSFITKPQYCPSVECESLYSCEDCLEYNDYCDWCLDSSSCIDITYAHRCGDVYNDPFFCPSYNQTEQIVTSPISEKPLSKGH